MRSPYTPVNDVRMSVAVCEMSGVWWLVSSTPLLSMKLSRFGICSRSDGTLGLSRVKCVLSNWMLMTCWICPLAELSWHPPVPPAALAVIGGPAATAAATTLAIATRLVSLRQRLAFTTRPPFSNRDRHTQPALDFRPAAVSLQGESSTAALTDRDQRRLSR